MIEVPSAVSESALLSARVASRFRRLQDTLADKFLPTLLDALAEPKASAIDSLDRAEKLGWLESTDDWLELRKLRNQMAHEYIEDLVILSNALKVGHEFVHTLVDISERFVVQAQRRISISLS